MSLILKCQIIGLTSKACYKAHPCSPEARGKPPHQSLYNSSTGKQQSQLINSWLGSRQLGVSLCHNRMIWMRIMGLGHNNRQCTCTVQLTMVADGKPRFKPYYSYSKASENESLRKKPCFMAHVSRQSFKIMHGVTRK